VDAARLLPELNVASLRAAGHFLEKLELKSLDNPAGDEASHVVNRVFIRYSNLITRTLSFGRALSQVSPGQSWLCATLMRRHLAS
jgi:hypothetical protein